MSQPLLKTASSFSPSPAQVIDLRRAISNHMLGTSRHLRESNFQAIGREDLAEMFVVYDELFFARHFGEFFDSMSNGLTFRLSKRMTSAGGMTTYRRDDLTAGPLRSFEIVISTTLLFNTEFDKCLIRVGGVPTDSRLDALQRIFEHELVHLLELCLWDNSSCSKSRFRQMIRQFFGHTESNHQLLTPAETAKTDFGIKVGDSVEFWHESKRLRGFVNRVNKRATVLVASKKGEAYDDGQQYVRFYVPVDELAKV